VRITVLGHWGAYPEPGDATTGVLLEHEDQRILIDCGSGVLTLLGHYVPPESLTACFISHWHHDHTADLGALQYNILLANVYGKRQGPLPVWAPADNAARFAELHEPLAMTPTAITTDLRVTVGSVQVEFAPTRHPVPCYAMAFTAGGKRFVFTADTAVCDTVQALAQGADLLLAECNNYPGTDGTKFGHLNATEVGELATKAGARFLALTHLPHQGNHAELVLGARETYKGPIDLVRRGWTYTL
jgi:ribonuclease BN (tRNA processing enzyme)